MPEPIHSSSWTGPIDVPPDDTGALVDQAWAMAAAKRQANAVDPETKRRIRLGLALLLSPLLLFVSSLLAELAIPDAFLVERREWLVLWGVAMAAFAILDLRLFAWSGSDWSSRITVMALSATLGVAVFYDYAVITAHGAAVPSITERTFELTVRNEIGDGVHLVHLRRDGSTVEGEGVGPVPAYQTTCTDVQRLYGDYGFVWIRVIDRSPPPAHEIAWPIRAEDCFSDRPVASLNG